MRKVFVVVLACFWLVLSHSSLGLVTLTHDEVVNYEVQALMDIKESLKDTDGVLNSWTRNSVDPCSWAMLTCSPDGLVTTLAIPSRGLSGTLSPNIGNLTHLQTLLLQNNNISGHIPDAIGKLSNIQTLDLSHNLFTGRIPPSLSHLNNLQHLDLSYNNLSGPVPSFRAKTTFNVAGNAEICGASDAITCNNNRTATERPAVSFSNSSSSSSSNSQAYRKLGGFLQFVSIFVGSAAALFLDLDPFCM